MAFSRIKRFYCMSCVPGEMQKVHWRRCSNFFLLPLPPQEKQQTQAWRVLRSCNNDLPLLTHLMAEVKVWSQKNYNPPTAQITPLHHSMSRRPLGLTQTCILPPFIFVLTRSLGLPGYSIALSSPDFYVYSQIQNLLTFSAGTPGLSAASLNFSFRDCRHLM